MDHPAPVAPTSSEMLPPSYPATNSTSGAGTGTNTHPFLVDASSAASAAAGGGGGAEQQEASSKRTALAGQWRTPPLPVFPTTTDGSNFNPSFEPSLGVASTASTTTTTAGPTASSTTAASTVAVDAAMTSSSSLGSLPLQEFQLPDSTEDYAKALQEAYRRGAEAAALAAAQAAQQHSQQHHQQRLQLPPSLSCPNFLLPPQPQQQEHQQQQQQQQQQPHHPSSFAAAPAPSPPPPPPVPQAPPPLMTEPGMVPFSIPAPTTNTTMNEVEDLTAYFHPFMPPPPPPQPQPHSSSSSSAFVGQMRNSMSLPNMMHATGTHHGSTGTGIPGYSGLVEEEKRLKRLARNRQSARMRRMRKKNLIDAYETEVGILEKTLQALKNHEWGSTFSTAENSSTNSVSVLTEALSMDRGQQVLDKDERQQAAADILRQQLEYVELLEELMQEQYVLHQVGMLLQEQQQMEQDGNDTSMDDASMSMLQELVQELQLTPDQMKQLQTSRAGWEEEWGALQTIKQSLQAMLSSTWLWNEGCTAVAEELLSVLHKNQVSKFLLWADANLEAIDELDGVNAPHLVPQGPVFSFGVNNNPESLLDLMDEEKS